MLKKRLIPKLLIKNLKIGDQDFLSLVTSNEFKKYKIVGDPVSQAKIYESQLADELIILFIDKDFNIQSEKVKQLLNDLSSKTFMPITIGGGIRNLSDIKFLMKNGADKISLNTQAFLNKKLISQTRSIYGSQCIVISIDYYYEKNNFFVKKGNKFVKYNLIAELEEFKKEGAGEILLTNVKHDGKEKGMDIENLRKFRSAIDLPIIASGGCGLAKHFSDCFIKADVDAISAGTFFCFRDQNPMQTRSHIKNSNINIRI